MESNRLEITTLALGEMEVNTYVLRELGSQDCVVIDCPGPVDELVDFLQTRNLNPKTLLLTHSHFDHIMGLHDFCQVFPQVEVCQHIEEKAWLETPALNLSQFWNEPVTAPVANRIFETEGEIGIWDLRALHVPGHSPGSLVYWCPENKVMFSGDVIFRGSIGRTDFPGCDADLLTRGIAQKILPLDDQITIYPGHGPDTTLHREKRTNPWIRPLLQD